MILDEASQAALWCTLRLAGLTTFILFIIGTPLAWWLSRTKFRFKVVIETVVALPLVLPPTVLGFYLLITLGPNGPVGIIIKALGGDSLAFTFSGLVVGSVIYSLPFFVQPLQDAFSAVGNSTMEAAATLHASPLDSFFSVAVPLARPGFFSATVLAFAHTIGEFGVVLMLGGNIPGKTKVLSIAIYDHVEAIEYGQAHFMAGGLLLLSFLMLIAVYSFNQRFRVTRSHEY